MRLKVILHVLGALLCSSSLTMLLPIGLAAYDRDAGLIPLIGGLGIGVAVGAALMLFFKKDPERTFMVNHREGMAIVAIGWLACGIAGALPYIFSGFFPSAVDAVFESISGFTTTGASILTDIEALPRSLLLWRALTHWLGGMGIIVFSLAILPYLGVGGMQMYKAELASPTADKIHPRLHDTAMALWRVYLILTVALVGLLLLGGMDLFEAVSHSFATLATGGFSTRNASVGYYNSNYINWVLAIFMFLSGASFSLHYHLLKGRPGYYLKSTEFCWYAFITLAAVLLVAFSIHGANYRTLGDSFCQSAFQVTSILTTTGFATADYTLWTPGAQAVILLLFFIGGSAGSTAGGIKVIRVVTLIKAAYYELFRLVHPRGVRVLKANGRGIPPETISGIVGFFVLYLLLLALCGLALSFCGLDISAAFSGVLSCIGNVGPGFGSLGPASNYAAVPAAGKVILSLAMLLGRLEICTIFILFVPEFWRK